MAQMGLFGLLIPREYEGLGFSVLDTCLVSEELAKGGLAFVRLIAGGGLGIVELLMLKVMATSGMAVETAGAITIADRIISYWSLLAFGGISYFFSTRVR